MSSKLAVLDVPEEQLLSMVDWATEYTSDLEFSDSGNQQPKIVYLPPAKREYYYDYEVDETEKKSAQRFFTSPEFLKISAQISKKRDLNGLSP